MKLFQLFHTDGEFLITEGDGVADDAGGGMNAFVKLLGPEAHARAADGIGGAQTGLWVGVVEIFADNGGFDNYRAVIYQRGTTAFGLSFKYSGFC